ncbi:hypothetical protein [Duncaniella freteri]|uniref:hypothetical protein n=1 Tax=Duncaniella freteri TaxID=2530391 RepID=UPI003F66CEBA
MSASRRSHTIVRLKAGETRLMRLRNYKRLGFTVGGILIVLDACLATFVNLPGRESHTIVDMIDVITASGGCSAIHG